MRRPPSLPCLFPVASIDASVSRPDRTAEIAPVGRLLSLAISPLDLLDTLAFLRPGGGRGRGGPRGLTGDVGGLRRCRHWDRLRCWRSWTDLCRDGLRRINPPDGHRGDRWPFVDGRR